MQELDNRVKTAHGALEKSSADKMASYRLSVRSAEAKQKSSQRVIQQHAEQLVEYEDKVCCLLLSDWYIDLRTRRVVR